MAFPEVPLRASGRRRLTDDPPPAPDPRHGPHGAGAGGNCRRAGPAPHAATLTAVFVAAALATLPGRAAAQGIEERIRALGAANGRAYTHPVSSGLGAGLNSGWFHSATALGPLHVEIGVRAVGSFVPEQDESFRPVLPGDVTVPELDGRSFSDPYGTAEGLVTPTAVGQGPGVSVPPAGEFRVALLAAGLDPADFALRFPGGFDLPAVPVGTLQLNVGVARGVEVAGRFVPSIELEESLGDLQSVGGGIKLSVTDWVEVPIFLDLAVAGGFQSYDVGDYLSAEALHASLLASKTLSGLTLFVTGTLESSDTEVSYTVENPRLPGSGTTIEFEDEGENAARFTAGFSLDVLFLQLTADYAVSDYEAVSAGLGVRF